MEHPLAGIRVLDASRVLAGPYAGRMLAALGADVVKVEPPEGDITRIWGARRHGLSGYYTQQNSGKRNVCIDLKSTGGRDLFLRLARAADVVIENFRPGVMARLGLDWPALSAANPALVLLSISGYGQAGPESHRPAYAPILHAEAGVVARQAAFDRAPASDPVLSIADMNAGLHGLVGLLAALRLRDRTGQGQHVDIAMLDSMLGTDDYLHFTLDEIAPVRGGGEVWDAPGGPIMIAGDFRYLWRMLTEHHGLVDPTPEGASLPQKIAARRGAVAAFFRSFAERAKLTDALDALNFAWGDVRTTAAALASPSAAARGIVAELDDRGGGTRRVVQAPYRFSNARAGIETGAPYRGEHNREVLAQWCGIADPEVDRLLAENVLQAEQRPERSPA
jgi:CoA:oxalate CoA-transferase